MTALVRKSKSEFSSRAIFEKKDNAYIWKHIKTSLVRTKEMSPVISKLIENHVTKHLFGYLNKYDILRKLQSGFRKSHSCNTDLINLMDKWLKSINKGETTGAIFLDLKKPFDLVNNKLIVRKLQVYKIDIVALDWMTSYLG